LGFKEKITNYRSTGKKNFQEQPSLTGPKKRSNIPDQKQKREKRHIMVIKGIQSGRRALLLARKNAKSLNRRIKAKNAKDQDFVKGGQAQYK